MTDDEKDVPVIKNPCMVAADEGQKRFMKKMVRLNALASPLKGDDSDIDEMVEETRAGLAALNAVGTLQEMLVAQMLSVHQLQQVSMAMVNKTKYPEATQFFTNSCIKLSNVFIQQASLLSRLQGSGGQRVTVGRVDVHQGGQAVVGSVIGAPSVCEVSKT